MNFLRAIPRGTTLIVHSAFSSFHRAGITCEGVIETLLDHVGTLLMPTMTWRTVTPANPVFDAQKTKSHTGVLSEIFRTRYATHRSLHPTHSVAGCGSMAMDLLSTHHIGNTPVPITSPYGLLGGKSAHILMLGVGLECCTAIHHPEEIIAPDVFLMDDVEKYTIIDGDTAIPYQLRRHKRLPRNFHRYDFLTTSGYMRGCPWRVAEFHALIAEVATKLTNNVRYHLDHGGPQEAEALLAAPAGK